MNRFGRVWLAVLFLWLPNLAWSAEDSFRQGVAALQAKDYDRALACFDAALQTNPEHAAAHEGRGLAHAGKQAYDLAISDYDEAIHLAPKSPGTYYNRGNARLGKTDYDVAIADFTQAIILYPGYAEAYNNRGLARAGQRDFAGAVADHGQAIRFDTRHDATLYLNRGLAYVGEHEYEKALADFSEAIRLDPRLASARFHRANVCVRQRDFDQALADYSEALAVDPTFAGARHNRGNVYLCRKEYDLAVADYDEAIRLDPKQPESYFHRGLAHAGGSHYDLAIADYQQTDRLEPEYAKARGDLGVVFFGSAAYDGAVFRLSPAGALPSFPEAFYQRGNAHLQRQEFDQAIADYTAALSLSPNDGRGLTNRAAAHVAKRDFDKAREDFTSLARLDPNNANTYYRRGLLGLWQHDYERAVADFGEVISLDPSHALAFAARSRAWAGLNKPDKASADQQKANRLEAAPDALAAINLEHAGWQRLVVDLPDLEEHRSTAALDSPAPFPVAATEVADLTSPTPPSSPGEIPTVVPALAREMADQSAQANPAHESTPPAGTPNQLPAGLVLAEELDLMPTRRVRPAPEPSHETSEAAPANQRYAPPADFWCSPAMFLAVVLAALVIGAGMVSIPLLLLSSRLGKSGSEQIDIEKLVSALLRDREREIARPAKEPPANRIETPLPAPLRRVPAAIPAATASESSAGTASESSAGDDADLIKNILAENLSLREEDAAAGALPAN